MMLNAQSKGASVCFVIRGRKSVKILLEFRPIWGLLGSDCGNIDAKMMIFWILLAYE